MMTVYQWLLVPAVVIHGLFAILETVRWSDPLLLRGLIKKKLGSAPFTPEQKKLVANIVKNAGIYNGIVAAALFWSAYTEEREVARVLLTGAIVAGVFGALTLSPKAWWQVAAGAAGLIGIYFFPPMTGAA